MVKRSLRKFITSLISSDKTKEEKEIITNDVMGHIGTSDLSTRIDHYDHKGRIGIFYDIKDGSLFREEIKGYLIKVAKRNIVSTTGQLEEKVSGKKLPDSPKVFDPTTPLPTPPPSQITPNQACEYLKEKYNVEITKKDLKKVIQGTPLTRGSLDDAYRFKLFELIPTILVKFNFRDYEVTVNNKKGVPRYICERKAVLSELFKE